MRDEPRERARIPERERFPIGYVFVLLAPVLITIGVVGGRALQPERRPLTSASATELLEEEAERARQRPVPRTVSRPTPAPVSPDATPTQDELPPQDGRAKMHELVESVRKEGYDSAWAATAQAELEQALDPLTEAHGDSFRVEELECRSQRCLMQIHTATSEAQMDLRVALMLPSLPRVRQRLEDAPNGGTNIQVVLARDGYLVSGESDSLAQLAPPAP